MSIKKYTNFDNINSNITNEGQYLQPEDLFIVTKNEIEEADFGDCKYDVMEVSVYDINNVLLPHKSGKSVEYIKTQHIGEYMYPITNKLGKKELAINIEKLLNDLGFTNGILKVNINFVRSRVGSENELERVWIHEISPSREEVRIIPLKTNNDQLNVINKTQFSNLNNLNKDFKYYKKNILDALDSFERTSLDSIDDSLVAKFGNDFKNTIRKDFGLRDLSAFRKRIFNDFKDSVTYWVNNRNYDIKQSSFGKVGEERFNDCDQYDFNYLINTIKDILNNCIEFNIKTLSRRRVKYDTLPVEFSVTEVQKQIQNLVDSYSTKIDIKRNIYSPDKVDISFKGIVDTPPPTPVEELKRTTPIVPPPVEAPAPTIEPPYIAPPASGGGGGGGRSFNEPLIYDDGLYNGTHQPVYRPRQEEYT